MIIYRDISLAACRALPPEPISHRPILPTPVSNINTSTSNISTSSVGNSSNHNFNSTVDETIADFDDDNYDYVFTGPRVVSADPPQIRPSRDLPQDRGAGSPHVAGSLTNNHKVSLSVLDRVLPDQSVSELTGNGEDEDGGRNAAMMFKELFKNDIELETEMQELKRELLDRRKAKGNLNVTVWVLKHYETLKMHFSVYGLPLVSPKMWCVLGSWKIQA